VVSTAPVLLLIHRRPDTTQLVMDAIRAARPLRLYVAADGPRNAAETELCNGARRIAIAVDWPCEVRTLYRDRNLGCREAVSGAITWFFDQEEEGIILEDDCLPSADFFRFCSELLERFRSDPRIMAICGSCYADAGGAYPASYYFSYYADIWGWATWRRAWKHYDLDMSRWPNFRRSGRFEALARGHDRRAAYWAKFFDAAHERRIDTWDYQWMYAVMEQSGLACYPIRNLVSNLGYRADATHTLVADAGSEKGPLANLPHQKLDFPLVHPRPAAGSAWLDRQIEMRRLGLVRPSFIGDTLAEKARSIGRWLSWGTDLGGLAGRWRNR
jgi:hypothetical protein